MPHFPWFPRSSTVPRRNLELRLRAAFLAGGKDSEFDEKQNGYRVEFRVR